MLKQGINNFFLILQEFYKYVLLIINLNLIFRNSILITNLWLPLTSPQNEDYNYLNIDLNPEMKIFCKGKERWNWENRKETF